VLDFLEQKIGERRASLSFSHVGEFLTLQGAVSSLSPAAPFIVIPVVAGSIPVSHPILLKKAFLVEIWNAFSVVQFFLSLRCSVCLIGTL